jgi:rifampicin phosphotransferase
MPRSILRFSEVRPEDQGAVGNKAWFLSRLAQAGLDVPAGLVIPREALAPASLPELWEPLSVVLPEVLRLEDGIAVRSSSSAEDTADQSMAGQFLTILRVKSWAELRAAIERCARSQRSDGEAGTAAGNGASSEAPAVILMAMVEADLAGVAFSRDPVGGEGDSTVIEYCPGTAERLVSAEISPFRATIRGDALGPVPGSPTPPVEHHPVLMEVSALARRIEELFGFPVDMEWAARDRRVRVLQARPITRRAIVAGSPAAAAPGGSWTRRIAEDLWADPLTTFEEDLLVSLSPRFDLRRWARYVGLVIPPGMRTLGGIQSHLYLNCAVLEPTLAMLPRALRLDQVTALFPPGVDPLAAPAPGFFRTLRAVLGALFLGLTRLEANPLTCAGRLRRRTARIRAEARVLHRRRLSALSSPELKAHLQGGVDLLARLLESNQFGYLFAVTFSWLVEHVARTRGVPREAWLGELGGTEANATRRQVSLLGEVGEALKAGAVGIEGRSFAQVIEELKGRGMGKPAAAAEVLLEEYGVRSAQRSLVEPRWAERPEVILEHARNVAREAPRRPPSTGSGTPPPGLLLRSLLRIANRYLDLREDLRFAIDGVLHGLRGALLEIGRRFDLGRQAFFLDLEEARSLLDGALAIEAARERSKARLDRFLAAPPPPLFWVDGVPVAAGRAAGNSLAGVGASPGIVRGKVRVVERLEEAEGALAGEVIVARMMGPAWTPILRFAGAVVTEKGGLLDHFAILAREAGVPAVTGAEGATEALRAVEVATVDGARGVVTW